MDPDPSLGRLEVRSGAPTPADLAALVVALTPAAPSDAGGSDDAPAVGDAVPAWATAALLEGTGAPRVSEPASLHARPT
ncbi:hypothetical protein [Egicoccus halophilus]|uniref:Uncharacterized protein n=1 Tax=Egicoccus halophilus TaxID=1670830 RepID=A0A8J3A7K2_9ACTN|nr:hypothetical protein [Egicoccus halophilus]GGI03869.1 hypothetical protein GCM10011354_06200 [Egicoccus halophilus]